MVWSIITFPFFVFDTFCGFYGNSSCSVVPLKPCRLFLEVYCGVGYNRKLFGVCAVCQGARFRQLHSSSLDGISCGVVIRPSDFSPARFLRPQLLGVFRRRGAFRRARGRLPPLGHSLFTRISPSNDVGYHISGFLSTPQGWEVGWAGTYIAADSY